MKFTKLFLIALILILSGCATLVVSEIEDKRKDLDTMAATAIKGLIVKDQLLQSKLDNALAYGVANMKVSKVPVVGAGGGEGVLVIKETNERVYFTVSRFDVGGGWGVRSYKALMLFNTQELVEQWKGGKWRFEAGAEVSGGSGAAEGASVDLNTGFSMHILADGGASATVTARVIRVKVNKELTN
jgi:hypothetical protein|tara:strand:+ start:1042 stop:1599 length:558 start_codon:yes stop_codon:yes gene_type:complete